jgi:hypothetical protein
VFKYPLRKGHEARMVSDGRKVILFVDKCADHPPYTLFLRNVKVIFLLPIAQICCSLYI